MKIYGQTDIGTVRESNQDTLFYEKFGDDFAFVVICDGMGGENGGIVASKILSDFLAKNFRIFLENGYHDGIRTKIFDLLSEGNNIIFEKSLEDHNLEGMGTTVVGAVVINDDVFIFNIGDSRAYWCDNLRIKQITNDHSYVQTLVDSGKITKDEAMWHPRKNELIRVVGTMRNIDADLWHLKARPGSYLLLCTDGLTNFCDNSSIKKVIDKGLELKKCVRALMDLAVNYGSDDNITVSIVSF